MDQTIGQGTRTVHNLQERRRRSRRRRRRNVRGGRMVFYSKGPLLE